VIIGEFYVRYPEFVKLTLLISNNALRVQIELLFGLWPTVSEISVKEYLGD